MAVNLTVVTPSLPSRLALRSECIGSVAGQTVLPTQHVVVLDLNTRGPSVLRNMVARAADTEWVLFLDDDDLLDHDFIETIEPYLVRGNDVVYTWCRLVGREDIKGWHVPFNADMLRNANYIPVVAAVRTSLFREVEGFPVGVAYEDWGLWLRLLNAGAQFRCVPQVKWTYRWHGENRSFANDTAVGEGTVPAV